MWACSRSLSIQELENTTPEQESREGTTIRDQNITMGNDIVSKSIQKEGPILQ